MSKKKERKYNFMCECGHKIKFTSKQPTGASEPVICERCHEIHILEIPQRDEKYLYKLQDEKFQLRMDIYRIYTSYREKMTVRQMFYRLLSLGYEKSESFYGKVQREMLKMRVSGVLPFTFVADNTRSWYRPTTYSSMEDMLERSKRLYRRSLWDNVNCKVEIWLEKEALRGVLMPVTDQYDVPLYITKGFTSVSFVQEAALEIKSRSCPTYVYLFADHDPSGDIVADSIKDRMIEFGAEDNAVFERAGLTSQQIEEYDLPSRPTKKSNHSKNWDGGRSVELDALEPQDLRGIVKDCITRHLDERQYRKMLQIEEAEKETLDTFINNWRHA